ncbi:tRNA delta(2)-isopentenylpyrophosphate transferase [Chlamydia trachomatis]|nr:tRNA delta(2)-isopentenylpyrophosphate transferase [Chlamydia trachomatis]
MTANAYPLIRKYLDNEIDLEKLIELMSIRDWQLAKRQITFMKRNKKIHWLQLEEAEAFIEKELS